LKVQAALLGSGSGSDTVIPREGVERLYAFIKVTLVENVVIPREGVESFASV